MTLRCLRVFVCSTPLIFFSLALGLTFILTTSPPPRPPPRPKLSRTSNSRLFARAGGSRRVAASLRSPLRLPCSQAGRPPPRAIAQRFSAVAPLRHADCIGQCPLSGAPEDICSG